MKTRGQVRTQIAQWMHRSDLSGNVDEFIDNVTTRLQRRLGISLDPMNGLNDTNMISMYNPDVYLYGALREAAIFTGDRDATADYNGLYEKEIVNLNINYNGDEWENSVPYVRSELEG